MAHDAASPEIHLPYSLRSISYLYILQMTDHAFAPHRQEVEVGSDPGNARALTGKSTEVAVSSGLLLLLSSSSSSFSS